MLDAKPQFDCPIDRAPLGTFWSRKNVGHSQGISRDQRATLIETMGEDDTATQMTISCQIRVRAADIPPEAIPAVVGRLRWGNGGTTTTAEFDFVNGTVIGIAAAAVSLIVELEDPSIEIEVIPTAHIGYLPHAGLNAVRTRSIDLGPGQGGNIVIPPFARSVVIQRIPQESLVAEILDPAGVSISQLVIAGTDLSPRFLIPQSGRQLRLIVGGGVAVKFRPVFELYI